MQKYKSQPKHTSNPQSAKVDTNPKRKGCSTHIKQKNEGGRHNTSHVHIYQDCNQAKRIKQLMRRHNDLLNKIATLIQLLVSANQTPVRPINLTFTETKMIQKNGVGCSMAIESTGTSASVHSGSQLNSL